VPLNHWSFFKALNVALASDIITSEISAMRLALAAAPAPVLLNYWTFECDIGLRLYYLSISAVRLGCSYCTTEAFLKLWMWHWSQVVVPEWYLRYVGCSPGAVELIKLFWSFERNIGLRLYYMSITARRLGCSYSTTEAFLKLWMWHWSQIVYTWVISAV
jgi:hypothetical protein